MTQSGGQEILVVDRDPSAQKGLEQLLRGSDLVPTVLDDAERAVELAAEKFFSVALVDLDTPTPQGSLGVLRALRARAPATALVGLLARRAFEPAVLAFRAGALDVILKAPDQVEYLRDRVLALAARRDRGLEPIVLAEQAAALHEDMMTTLLDTWRRARDLEEHSQVDDGDVLDEVTTVLLVEEDGWLARELAAVLDERYELQVVSTGGEALDAIAGARSFQIALVKDNLPDLPGSMVVRTMKTQSQETIVLLFAPPARGRPGSVQVIETARSIPFLPQFTEARQLAERLGEVRDAFRATTRERRHLAAFRQHHFELLKRFADLRQKLQRARRGP